MRRCSGATVDDSWPQLDFPSLSMTLDSIPGEWFSFANGAELSAGEYLSRVMKTLQLRHFVGSYGSDLGALLELHFGAGLEVWLAYRTETHRGDSRPRFRIELRLLGQPNKGELGDAVERLTSWQKELKKLQPPRADLLTMREVLRSVAQEVKSKEDWRGAARVLTLLLCAIALHPDPKKFFAMTDGLNMARAEAERLRQVALSEGGPEQFFREEPLTKDHVRDLVRADRGRKKTTTRT